MNKKINNVMKNLKINSASKTRDFLNKKTQETLDFINKNNHITIDDFLPRYSLESSFLVRIEDLSEAEKEALLIYGWNEEQHDDWYIYEEDGLIHGFCDEDHDKIKKYLLDNQFDLSKFIFFYDN